MTHGRGGEGKRVNNDWLVNEICDYWSVPRFVSLIIFINVLIIGGGEGEGDTNDDDDDVCGRRVEEHEKKNHKNLKGVGLGGGLGGS